MLTFARIFALSRVVQTVERKNVLWRLRAKFGIKQRTPRDGLIKP